MANRIVHDNNQDDDDVDDDFCVLAHGGGSSGGDDVEDNGGGTVTELLPTVSRQQCIDDLGGTIVGDIGDGAIHRPDYICEPPDGLPLPRLFRKVMVVSPLLQSKEKCAAKALLL